MANPKNVLNVAEPSTNNGSPCYIVVPTNTAGFGAGPIATLNVLNGTLRLTMTPCPIQPAGGAAVVTIPTPEQFATNFWDTIRLPVPEPRTQPDFAVTGKVTYLTAGDTNAPPPWIRTTPFGALTITARGTYIVEWGDGTPPTGPYDNPGRPYPTGKITHTYDNTGIVTIVVHEAWTASWSVGGIRGTLRALRTTGTDPGFVVRQIQAVITGSS